MSVREFAEQLGISHRNVSKWEAGGADVFPRPGTQEILDDALANAAGEVQIRFELNLGLARAESARAGAIKAPAENGERDTEAPWVESQQVRHPVDGKLMVLVDAGVFLSGANNEPVYLSAFYIDVFPTTNADYARFIAATGHRAPMHWSGNRFPDGRQDHPVVNVTHRDASSYAKWAEKQLPSAEEWEKAARGTRGKRLSVGKPADPGEVQCPRDGCGQHDTC
jgi:formylglycine-generating enzyme required for sulfatase activity